MKFRITIFLFCILISGFCFQTAAHAACFNPPGNAGDLNYNGGYRTFEYCDGGTWVRTGGAGDTRTGLVGWWKFDDGSGTSAADSSGNGNTSTLVNSPTWTTSGMNGGALTFNGTTQYVTVPDIAALDLSGSWTVSAWVNLSALPASGYAAAIFAKPNSNNDRNYELDIDNGYFNAGTGVAVQFNDSLNNGQHVKYATSITTGTWYLLTGVWDSSAGNLYMYLNGVLVATNTPSHSPLGGAECCSAQTRIGDSYIGANTFFAGTVDDLRVYNRALTANDIKTLYTSTGGTSGDINSNLVGWWKLDDGTSGSTPATAVDSSGNNSTGTLSGTTLPTWTTSGKIGNALVFANASNNYVDVANQTPFAFDRTNPFTLSAWVYRTSTAAESDIAAKMTGPTAWTGYSLWLPANGQATLCNAVSCTTNCIEVDLTNTVSGSNNACVLVNGSGVTTNAWHHVVMTYDGSSAAAGITVYVDGAAQTPSATHSSLTASILTAADFKIGTDAPGNGDSFTGTIDDVRVYSRTLSPADVLTLYNTTATACAGPVGYTGDLMYNAGTYHVPQFCNGTNWIPVGPVSPVGAGGGGCSSPAGSEGDVRFSSSTSRAMTYCDGTHWHAMGNIPISGLVAWWNFDEGSGTVAADSSGNGNTGTLVNTPIWTTSGMNNGALAFNGNPNMDVTVPAFNDNAASMSYAYWIYVSSGQDTYTTVFSTGTATSMTNGTQHQLNVAGAGDTKLQITHYSSGSYTTVGTITLNLNAWNHVVEVVNGNASTIYLNGLQALSASGTRATGNQALTIGGDQSTSVLGTIDDVRVYNRALSASEIWELYSRSP